jgi:hypothetical protein
MQLFSELLCEHLGQSGFSEPIFGPVTHRPTDRPRDVSFDNLSVEIDLSSRSSGELCRVEN